MGDLAASIAAIVRFAHPEPALPRALCPVFAGLGYLTVDMAEHLRALVRGRTRDFAAPPRADGLVDQRRADILSSITATD